MAALCQLPLLIGMGQRHPACCVSPCPALLCPAPAPHWGVPPGDPTAALRPQPLLPPAQPLRPFPAWEPQPGWEVLRGTPLSRQPQPGHDGAYPKQRDLPVLHLASPPSHAACCPHPAPSQLGASHHTGRGADRAPSAPPSPCCPPVLPPCVVPCPTPAEGRGAAPGSAARGLRGWAVGARGLPGAGKGSCACALGVLLLYPDPGPRCLHTLV